MPRWPDRCFSYAGLPLTEEDMVKNGANGSAANILKSKAPIKNNQISWARLLAGMGGTQWQMTEGHSQRTGWEGHAGGPQALGEALRGRAMRATTMIA